MFLKSLKVANYPKNAAQMVKKLKTFMWLVFFQKKRIDTFLKKKSWIFVELLKVVNLMLNSTETVKISQSAQKLSFHKKLDIFRKKILNDSKITKGRIFSVGCKWNDKILQNVRNLGFFKTNYGFFWKRVLNFLESPNFSNLLLNATESVNFGKTFKNWVF